MKGTFLWKKPIGDQISRLQSQKEELTAALEFCGRIKENQLADVDPDLYLEEMEQEEKRGSVFMDFVNDYARVEDQKQSGSPLCLMTGVMSQIPLRESC